jgi:hypothetical protein
MSGIHPWRTLSVLALSAASLALNLALVTDAAPASATSNQCHQVSLAEVSSTLGLKVTQLTPVLSGDVTVCWYQVGANPDAVFLRTQTHDNVSGYTLDKKAAAKQGESPVTDQHFAPYSAFSTSIGSPTYGFTYSVTILKKTTELDVGAANSKLTKVENLAKKVLALL